MLDVVNGTYQYGEAGSKSDSEKTLENVNTIAHPIITNRLPRLNESANLDGL